MKSQSQGKPRAWLRAGNLAAAAMTVVGLGAVSGCLTRPLQPIEPLTTSTVVERVTQSAVNQIDLLLVVDNSRSMADKQQILAAAVPDLIIGLLNPPCVDMNGTPVPTAMQPADSISACPAGTNREFPAVFDVHVGLVSSSLGSFGADGCPDTVPNACPNGASSTSNNDHGHLVTRTDPCAPGTVPTWSGQGFLAWDPKMALNPVGETKIGDTMTAGSGIVYDLAQLVIGDGQSGCGFESQNEAWYRFLVDPSPYSTITLNGQNAVSSGMDSALLTQRGQFLRDNSLLAIVNVTDETDTSIKEFGFYPLFAQEISNNVPFHLPHPRQECASKGPNDMCCGSCGQAPPSGCPVDPMCTSSPNYTDADENLALRAFGLISHKQRYGIEFFYQPSRYVTALTSAMVPDSNNNMQPNPIFAKGRDPGLVFYAAIVGVPWQLIARQLNGTPDLVNGVSAVDSTEVGGFKSFEELNLKDPAGNTFWDDIVGDPEHYVLAKSPYMIESSTPRSGTDPITGTMIAPSTAANGTNPINGHEWNITMPAGDIQYACIFPVLSPIDCSKPGAVCDCTATGMPNNPLCDPNPNDNMNLTLQSRAKAYPGLKHLAIAKGLGDQGIVASICAKQINTPNNPDGTPAADYGYRPAVKAIIDRLKKALKGQCLPRTLTADPTTGQVPCLILEARNTNGSACTCDPTLGRSNVSSAHQAAVMQAQQQSMGETWNCFCEINQTLNDPNTMCPVTETTGAPANCNLTSCQNDVNPMSSANGWCYVDDTGATAIGNPTLVKNCPSNDRRLIRFVGAGQPQSGATVFITCEGQ